MKNNAGGFWHVWYLIVFYLSTTFCLIFIYLAAQSQKWISFKGDIINRTLLDGQSTLSKNVLLLIALFFVLNTIYLVKKKE